MTIASQYIRGAKVPVAAEVKVMNRIEECVQVTVPPVLPPIASGIMSLTAGFPTLAIREVTYASNTPTATEAIGEAPTVVNTATSSESISETVKVEVK